MPTSPTPIKRSGRPSILPTPNGLACLDAQQITQIDRALAAVGDFGEIRLVKIKGKLRFIQKLDSEELTERPRPG